MGAMSGNACPVPGMADPAYSLVLSSLVSIHATPVTRLVYTELGRRKAAYMVGMPSTVRPIGCH